MIHKYLRKDTSVSWISTMHSAGVLDIHSTVNESRFQSGLCVFLFVIVFIYPLACCDTVDSEQ